MRSYLRVKIKSLAVEARIIRHEERRLLGRNARVSSRKQLPDGREAGPGPKVRTGGMIPWARSGQAEQSVVSALEREYNGLREHRIRDVREEARSSQLAYAFIRGRPYAAVEDPRRTRKRVNFGRVAELVRKYGAPESKLGTPEQRAHSIRVWVNRP